MPGRVYTSQELDVLETAFDLVKDKDDWRKPIDTLVHEKDIESLEVDPHSILQGRWIIGAAIMHYTGSIPHIEKFDADTYRVRSAGLCA